MKDLKQLENKIGYKFKSLTILEEALTHSSYANEKHHGSVCNERLEILKEQLDERFLSCHKSYVANMDYIREFHGRELILEDERVIPVSKARIKNAKENFFAYVSGKL